MSKYLECTRAGPKTNFSLDSRCCLSYACMKTRRKRCKDYNNMTEEEKQTAMDWLHRNGYEVHTYVEMPSVQCNPIKDGTTSKEGGHTRARRSMLEV